MLFCKRVLVAREKLPRCFRAKNNSFFSTVNAMGVCKNVLFENFYLKKKFYFLYQYYKVFYCMIYKTKLPSLGN